MRNLLALVGALVVGFAGLGWYLGWYKLGMESGTPGHPKFNVEIEQDKIKKDFEQGEKKVTGALSSKQVSGTPVSLPSIPDGSTVIPPPTVTLIPPPQVVPDPTNPSGIPSLPPPPSLPSLPPPPTFAPNK